MLVELLDRFIALIDERRKPVLLHSEKEPEYIYHHFEPKTGALSRLRALPPCRQHQAADLDTVLAFAQRDAGAAIWYSRQEVVGLLDDSDRRDRVRLALNLSPQFKTLERLNPGGVLTWHGQKEFIQLLRISLAGCLGNASNLLPVVRQLKFRQLAEAAGSLQHGKASLGKHVESQLEGAGSLPEQVVLSVPVFLNLPLPSQQVLCAVDIDTAMEKLALIPLPGTLEEALQQAERLIAARLVEGLGSRETEVPVYYGQA